MTQKNSNDQFALSKLRVTLTYTTWTFSHLPRFRRGCFSLSETSKHPISNADTPVDFKTSRPETRSSQGPFPFFLNSCVSLIQNLRTLFWNFDRNPPIGRERGQILMGAEKKTNRLLPLTAFFLLVLSTTIPCVFSAANQPPTNRKSAQLQKSGSSAVFPLHGNVYPLGYDLFFAPSFGLFLVRLSNLVPFKLF